MLQAWITAPRGSLYFAAPATAYNLETLRTHVRALRDEDASRTCLAMSIGCAEDGTAVAKVAAFVTELTLEGIHVRFTAIDEVVEVRAFGGRPERRRRHARHRPQSSAQAHG